MTTAGAEARSAQRPRWQRWGLAIGRNIALAVVLGVILVWLTSQTPRSELPAERLQLLAGGEVSLHQLQGRPTLLYFWATWCSACTVSSPVMANFAARHPEVRVLAVSPERREVLQAYVDDRGKLPFEVALGSNQLLATLGVQAFPTSMMINSAGKPVWMRSGVLLPAELDLRLAP